ncbi:MAG: hypothetical protein WCX73_03850 [Candidatus Pacearchaeota archaeon]|jgi:hypothetical protein
MGNKMISLEQLQLLAQLTDSMEIAAEKLGESYEKKDGEGFFEAKKTILKFQENISEQIK